MTHEKQGHVEVFVKINEKKVLSEDKLHVNMDIVAVRDGQTVPNQKVFFEIAGKRKSAVIPDAGIIKNLDVIFDCVSKVRDRLLAWAEGSGIRTEVGLIPENCEERTVQDANRDSERLHPDQLQKKQALDISETERPHREFMTRMEADYDKMVAAFEKFGISQIGIPEWFAIKSSLTKETIAKILNEISGPTLLLIPPMSDSVWIEALKKGGKPVAVYADIADEDLWKRNAKGMRTAWRIVIIEGSNEPERKFSSTTYGIDKCVCTPDIYFALAMKFLAEGQQFDYACKTIINYIDEQKIGLVGGLKPDAIVPNGFLSFEKYYSIQMEKVGIRYYVEVPLGEQDNAKAGPKTFNLRQRESEIMEELIKRKIIK